MEYQGQGYTIRFQEGAVADVGINGCQTPDIINVLVKELTKLNVGPMANRETTIAITRLVEAKMWLELRTRDRSERGVEGTQTP